MGAIYICPQTTKIPQDIFQMFEKKGFANPQLFQAGERTILIYGKQFFKSTNYLNAGESALFVIGTCFYKNKTYEDGLQEVFDACRLGLIDADQLIGSFLLLFWQNNELTFVTDKAGVQNVFFNTATGISSSSFLACIAGVSAQLGKLRLNKAALTETLATGSLIGPDTLIEGIERYEAALHESFTGIARMPVKRDMAREDYETHKTSFDAEVDWQLKTIRNYVVSVKDPLMQFGTVSGLTGGFDSRLLYLALHKNGIQPELYTNSAHPGSQQVKIAKKLVTACGTTLHTPEPGSEQNLKDNFYFNDGLIRIYQIWLEGVKSKAYLKTIYKGRLISLSGVGGEQYRNQDHLVAKAYNLEHWISAERITKYSGNVFYSAEERNKIVKQLGNKIAALLKLENRDIIRRFDIKRFANEVDNSSTRVIRNNIENQLLFFLSPFTDFSVARSAYRAYTHLGSHHAFEKGMIFRLAPEYAGIETDYGYKINETVPLKYKVAPFLKSLFGLSLYNTLYFSKKKKALADRLNANEYLDLVSGLALPIDLSLLKSNTLLAPLLLETGFFLKEMEAYVAHD